MMTFADVALSAKTAALTAAATVASSLTWLAGAIPDPIGKLAALVGVVLSLIMCNYWLAQTRKVNLEAEKLRRELEAKI